MQEDLSQYVPRRVLVSVAHADDIEFGMSGTVARWIQAGAEATYVIITDNASGSNERDVDLKQLIQTRIAEQHAAAREIGVEDVRFLGYKDGTLEPTLTLRRELTRIIRDVRPDVVMTLDPTTMISLDNTYINHPDHRAAGEATLYAVFPSAETRPIFHELLDEGLEPHHVDYLFLTLSNQPNHREDISSVIELKRAALRWHKSQIGDDEINMIMAWNKQAGEEIGTDYAETFRVINLKRMEERTGADAPA